MSVTFLTSSSAVTNNAEVVSACADKQGFPSLLVAQLGEDLVALPTEFLSATVFAVSQKEDGSFALKVSVSGTCVNGVIVKAEKGNYNLKLSGWVKVYPESICPEGGMSVSDKEVEALLAYTKGSKLWFDLSGCDFLYLVLALGKENHYAKDPAGNRVPNGTDSQGRQLFQLEEHDVLTFPLGHWDAPLAGSGTGGGITAQGMSDAKSRVLALMSSGRSI
jgi:hypothetical protein